MPLVTLGARLQLSLDEVWDDSAFHRWSGFCFVHKASLLDKLEASCLDTCPNLVYSGQAVANQATPPELDLRMLLLVVRLAGFMPGASTRKIKTSWPTKQLQLKGAVLET